MTRPPKGCWVVQGWFEWDSYSQQLSCCSYVFSWDITTPEQIIADCGNDPSKKTTLDELLGLALIVGVAKSKYGLEQRQEVHGHVKIICKAMYPAPNYSQIFELGTSAFSKEYLTGKSCIFYVDEASHFGKWVHEGGENGATCPGKTVRQGECKGKYFHDFTAILVNQTTGEVLTEEERSHSSMIRKQNGNKKTKTK